MIEKEQIRNSVGNAMKRVNDILLDDNALSQEDDTVLLGEGAELDSMGFVNFLIALEDELAETTALRLNLSEVLNAGDGAIPKTMTAADLTDFLFELASHSRVAGHADASVS